MSVIVALFFKDMMAKTSRDSTEIDLIRRNCGIIMELRGSLSDAVSIPIIDIGRNKTVHDKM